VRQVPIGSDAVLHRSASERAECPTPLGIERRLDRQGVGTQIAGSSAATLDHNFDERRTLPIPLFAGEARADLASIMPSAAVPADHGAVAARQFFTRSDPAPRARHIPFPLHPRVARASSAIPLPTLPGDHGDPAISADLARQTVRIRSAEPSGGACVSRRTYLATAKTAKSPPDAIRTTPVDETSLLGALSTPEFLPGRRAVTTMRHWRKPPRYRTPRFSTLGNREMELFRSFACGR